MKQLRPQKDKPMRYMFYKNSEKLTEEDHLYLTHYLEIDVKLKRTYELKEECCVWFKQVKKIAEGASKYQNELIQILLTSDEVQYSEDLGYYTHVLELGIKILHSFVFTYFNC